MRGGAQYHRGAGPSHAHSRGGGGRHGGPQGPQPTLDKPKREAILDLAKYVNARIRVKFTGGREGVCVSPLRPRLSS
jgi:U6 snRNA-associated Sm-like protein LSm7